METYYHDNKAKELKRYASQISSKIADSISKNIYVLDDDEPMLANELNTWSKDYTPARIVLLDTTARIVGDSYSVDVNKYLLKPIVYNALDKKHTTTISDDKSTMYAAVSILDSADPPNAIGAVVVMISLEEINDILAQVNQKLLILTFWLAIIVLVIVLFISQLIIDPLKSLLSVVKKMTEGHLNQRVNVNRHDEFSELGEAFNDMTKKLEQVEISRQEFVSNVSHELKTPLSSMKVLSEALLLQENVPPEMYREFLQDITSEVDRMTKIVNELLALVRLDRMEQALNIEQVKVGKFMDDIVKRLSPLARQKNIELKLEIVKHVEIDADEMKLTLAVSNIVENAIKYTDEGGKVKVTVNADHQHAFISVQDNGIGISEEDINNIFVRFYRVDKTRDRETGGTGLGLAITHKTVLLHQGSIKITSKENEGTTFTVRLPIHMNMQAVNPSSALIDEE